MPQIQFMISADRRRRRRRKRNRSRSEEIVTTGSSAQTLPPWPGTHGRVPVSNVNRRYVRTSGGSATMTWLAVPGGRDD